MTAATTTQIPVSSPWRELPARSRWVWLAVDAVGVLVLLGLLALVLLPTYGSPQLFVAVLGFGLVGLGIGLLSAVRRWGALLTAGAAAAAWFLLGTPLLMPSAGVGVVVPTMRSLRGLATGPVTAWRDMLMLAPPIGETGNLLTVPGLLALVGSLLAISISLRTRVPTAAWIPLAVAWMTAAAFGAEAYRPVLVGALFFTVALVWSSFRSARQRAALVGGIRRVRPLRVVLAVASLALVAGLVAAVLPLVTADQQRQLLREQVDPPLSLQQFSSPLQGFRANISKRKDATLLEVTGLSEGDLVRLATMDAYDGTSFRVSSTADDALEETTFNRVGEWIADDTPGRDQRVYVQVLGYDGVWVPTVGRTTQVAFEGERALELAENFYYNRASGTGIAPVGVRQGDSYELGSRLGDAPTDEQVAAAGPGDAALPQVRGVPDQLKGLARRWSEGVTTAGAQAQTIATQLQQGYFSHGQSDEAPSLSGHSAARLTALLREPTRMVGDQEQYAVAMTLMMRELGVPARVVYGYRMGQSSTVRGENVTAWTEVQLAGLGWVNFFPTPPEDRKLDEDDVPPPPQPRPHVENPPPPPQRPESVPEDEQLPIDPGEPPAQENRVNWAEIGAWILLSLPVLAVVVPVVLILGLKMRRRGRRRKAPQPANRVAGAWDEVVDLARDLGRSPSVSATRSEQAEQLVSDFPQVTERTDPVAISRQADWMVFAPGQPSDHLAAEFWRTSHEVERGMRRSVGVPRSLMSRLSTKSFRAVRPAESRQGAPRRTSR